MKYFFWWNKVGYAKRLLVILKRMELIRRLNRAVLYSADEKYMELEGRRSTLTSTLLRNWNKLFFEFDVSEIDKLEADSIQFFAQA